MTFPIDSDTFLISDSHFGHKAALVKEPSRLRAAQAYGYEDFYTLHQSLWNEEVGKKDFVLHLGDLYYPGGFKYLKNLNGKKGLIVGNNDVERYPKLKELKDWRVQRGLRLEIEQKDTILEALKNKYGKSALKDDVYFNALVVDYDHERIMFSHFPVFNRKQNDRFAKTRDVLDDAFKFADCSLNIHGHLHSRQTQNSFCFNVCCEQLGFRPKKLKEILTLWRHKAFI